MGKGLEGNGANLSPTSYVLASGCPILIPKTNHKIPKVVRAAMRKQLVLQLGEDTQFPSHSLKAGSYLAIGLPFNNFHGDLVVFRTSTGIYTLGCHVSYQFLRLFKPQAPWIVLPTEGLDIRGIVEKVYTPRNSKSS